MLVTRCLLPVVSAAVLVLTSLSAQALTDEEAGPWLDLKNGGLATGPAQPKVIQHPDGTTETLSGGLINGSLLPEKGPFFKRIVSSSEAYGTGMMISLLENATTTYGVFIWPGWVTAIGEIAQQEGGLFPPHKSHQNGLDADIPFIGTKTYESVVDSSGQVTAKFLPEENWEFWRLLYRQQIIKNGTATSVVSMILVGPAIKASLCEWAQMNDMFADPENVEIMKKIRPTEGHDDHFHLRLRCSPYHSQCIDSGANSSLCP